LSGSPGGSTESPGKDLRTSTGSSAPTATAASPQHDATPSSAAHGDPSDGGTPALDPTGILSPRCSVSPSSTDHPVPTRPTTRLQRGIQCPKTYTNGTVRWCMSAKVHEEEPVSMDEALGNQKWCDAMDAEYQALLKNRTWHLIPCPKGNNIIGCKWVYAMS
jgi:histone deacetylase 1/2